MSPCVYWPCAGRDRSVGRSPTTTAPFWLIGASFLCLVGATAKSAADPAMMSGKELFKRQCAACHADSLAAPPRQGPPLAGVFGRKAGSISSFTYSPGFAKATWTWDEAHLNSWLTNPQAVIPGAIMPYRQSNADVRQTIIAYLRELR